ncbi:signal peptidase II [bacterium AH-315-J21]|nr:signal peptidase II [bacterium AH-315-J21]
MNSDNPTSDFDSTDNTDSSSAPLKKEEQAESRQPLTKWLMGIITSVIFFDQLTKHLALEALGDIPGKSISVIGDFLRWTLVYNEGGAMGTNLGGSALYGVIGVVILLVLGYYLWHNRHESKIALPLALIAGGAIGNLIDRFQMGKVVDFIDVDFFNVAIMGFRLERWWTFNIADSAISVALVYMLWYSFRSQPKPTNESEAIPKTGANVSEDVSVKVDNSEK